MMVVTRRQATFAVLGMALLPAACTSPNPVLYTLDTVSGVAQPGAPKVILLRDISIAPYLDRQQIVRSSANYQIAVEANNWWGEPFAAMIGRVLTAELDQRLPGSSVFGETGAMLGNPDATVEISVQRLDAELNGEVVLNAQIAVTFADGRRGRSSAFHATATPPTPDIRGEVMGMTVVVGMLADRVAELCRR
jgi:uncharacterized protein